MLRNSQSNSITSFVSQKKERFRINLRKKRFTEMFQKHRFSMDKDYALDMAQKKYLQDVIYDFQRAYKAQDQKTVEEKIERIRKRFSVSKVQIVKHLPLLKTSNAGQQIMDIFQKVEKLGNHHNFVINLTWLVGNLVLDKSLMGDMIKKDGVKNLFLLMHTKNSEVSQRAILGLANLAGAGNEVRKMLIQKFDILAQLKKFLKADSLGQQGKRRGYLELHTVGVLHAVSQLILNISINEAKSGEDKEQFSKCHEQLLPLILELYLELQQTYTQEKMLIEAITNLLRALFSLSEQDYLLNLAFQYSKQEQFKRFFPALMQSAKNNLQPKIQCIATRVVGDFVSADLDGKYSKVLMANGLVELIEQNLGSKQASIRCDTCWLLSNIYTINDPIIFNKLTKIDFVMTDYGEQQQEGLIPELIDIAQEDCPSVQIEAMFALGNAMIKCDKFLSQTFAKIGIFEPFRDHLRDLKNDPLSMCYVDGLRNMFDKSKFFQRITKRNQAIDIFMEQDGTKILDWLQHSQNEQVYKNTEALIDEFFVSDDYE